MDRLNPGIVIFDLDGVLVDVRDSYHRSIVETVWRFTGRRVAASQIYRWKSRPGYNDDWKLTFHWIRDLGGRPDYAEVTRAFQRLYLGKRFRGFISRERWLLERQDLRRLAARAELAIFTGRPRREALHTLKKFGVRPAFRRIVALEDVRFPKPHPGGLRRILNGRHPRVALYVGDNVDDALAARRAGVAFVGVVPRDGVNRRGRRARLLKLGARAVLSNVNELQEWLS